MDLLLPFSYFLYVLYVFVPQFPHDCLIFVLFFVVYHFNFLLSFSVCFIVISLMCTVRYNQHLKLITT